AAVEVRLHLPAVDHLPAGGAPEPEALGDRSGAAGGTDLGPSAGNHLRHPGYLAAPLGGAGSGWGLRAVRRRHRGVNVMLPVMVRIGRGSGSRDLAGAPHE